MTVAMLRLADEIGGQILIDGVSHASMTHQQLRAKLAIIPQEATMFAGISTILSSFHTTTLNLTIRLCLQALCVSTWTLWKSSMTLNYTAYSRRLN
eukprot:COSAG02_NODE_3403_length_6798_cov_63.887744_3_plen_96_part_00